MATTTKYITLDNLQTYTTNIKKYIGDEDAKKSIKVEKLTTANANAAISYRIYQNLNASGAAVADTQTWDIDIPFDKNVTSGTLKTIAADTNAGTPEKHYISLTLANQTDAVDIDITSLFDKDADLQDAIDKLNGTITVEGSVLYSIYNNAANAKYETVNVYSNGTTEITQKEYDALSTDEKATYSANGTKDITIKEAIAAAQSGATEAGKVTLTEAASATEGYLKTYVITQGASEVGKINIPKDFLVKSGKVVEFAGDLTEGFTKDGNAIDTLPTGITTIGKYIELTINVTEGTADNSVIYIAVADLVDVYTAQASATQVQLEISATNEISATIVDGSIDTAQVKDKAITKAKLSQEVQDALSATNGSFVYKGSVEALPSGGNAIGDAYTVGGLLKVCTTADDAENSIDAVFTDIAVNTTFLGTGYKIGETDVTVKKYIDSRIFVGTVEEIAAAEAAGDIDSTTFVVTVEEDSNTLGPAEDDDINDLFS